MLQEDSRTPVPPALRRGVCCNSLQLHSEEEVHSGDRGLPAPGLAALHRSLMAKPAPVLPPRVLHCSPCPCSRVLLLTPAFSSRRSPNAALGTPPQPPESQALPISLLFFFPSCSQQLRCHGTTSVPLHRPLPGKLQPPTDLPSHPHPLHGRDETLVQEGAVWKLPL